MDCPFCIIDKKQTEIIKDGKYFYVTLSNPRLVPGHLLIIPKRHIEKISELTKKEREELFELIIEFQEKILKKFSSGCDLKQHYRPFIKQSWVKVSHLHFHLQPREFKDELYEKCQRFETEKGIFKMLTSKERKKFVKLFGCAKEK